MDFSEKLRRLMEMTELTQETLSALIGISQSHISALLSGKRQPSHKLEKTIKKEFDIIEESWNSDDGPRMWAQGEERLRSIRSLEEAKQIASICYLPETIALADEINNLLISMPQRERTKTAAKLFELLGDISA